MIGQTSKRLFSCCHHKNHFKAYSLLALSVAFLNMNGHCLMYTHFYINLLDLVINYGIIISAEGKCTLTFIIKCTVYSKELISYM